MKKQMYFVVLILLMVSSGKNFCNGAKDSFNQLSSTVINQHNLQLDSSKIKDIVYKEGVGFVAVDKNRNVLFEVFPFDNGPDYPSEGIFRIIEKGKIGYADLQGRIIIFPQFDAALPFINGMAAYCEGCSERIYGEHKSWEGGKWGFINKAGDIKIPAKYDQVIEQFHYGIAQVEYRGNVILINKKGEQVKMDNMKYNEWINLLGNTAELIAKLFFENKVAVKMSWLNNDKYVFSANEISEYLQINILNNEGRELLEYDIIPLQSFSVKHENEFLISLTELSTVTDCAIVYSTFKPRERNNNDMETIEKFNRLFDKVIEKNLNQEIHDYNITFPENVQLISKKLYRHYADLQVAESGTVLPKESEWRKITNGKMIYLQIVPDIGVIKKRWIKTDNMPKDTYYTSVEDDLLNYFEEALKEVYDYPEKRNEVFNNAKTQIRELFSAANSYVNFLYDKYEERLRKWLFVDEEIIEKIYDYEQNIFEDYEPKQTPDTMLDYMPELKEVFEKLPDSDMKNLSELIHLFEYYKANSIIDPGQWEEGNLVLGANPKEYKPSRDELLLAEVGNRLRKLTKQISKNELHDLLKRLSVDLNKFEYNDFSFIHVDVMGSGRFYYVEEIESIKLFQEEK